MIKYLNILLFCVMVSLLTTLIITEVSKAHSTGNKEILTQLKTYKVYLSAVLGESDEYLPLIKMISELRPGETVDLHISGYGGSVDTLMKLINVIENSKGVVNTVVYGPVYSAHAVLATVGKNIKVYNNSFFMFHIPAVEINGTYVIPENACADAKGVLDRGKSAYVKCLELVKYNNQVFENVMKKYVYTHLTKKQVDRYKDGEDVYVYIK